MKHIIDAWLEQDKVGRPKQRHSGQRIFDRLTHHVHILDITGDSYRLKASLKRHKKQGGGAKQ